MDTYYRPAMLKNAYEAIASQTYEKLEIILINNGATPETIEYLNEVNSKDKRVKLINYTENQFSWDEPTKMIRVCLNDALNQSCGDLIWYQADDDYIASDYIERMVLLFEGNSECITAAGLPIGVEKNGEIIEGIRVTNYRPRYMPGHVLATDTLNHHSSRNSTMFGAPGTIFTIKKEFLLKAGGFHPALEISQLYGIVPFGVTGFDEEALFYWRKHDSQLNKILDEKGKKPFGNLDNLLRDWDIESNWQQINSDTAKYVVKKLQNNHCKECAAWFVSYFYRLKIIHSMRIVKIKGNQINFWKEVLVKILIIKKEWLYKFYKITFNSM